MFTFWGHSVDSFCIFRYEPSLIERGLEVISDIKTLVIDEAKSDL